MTITLRRRSLTLALLLLAGVMLPLVLPPTSVPRGPIDSAMPVVPPTDTTDVVPNTETSVPALANIDLQFRHGRQAVLRSPDPPGGSAPDGLIWPARWRS